jgi:hypothetical protein
MMPLQIFERHPEADAYRVGGFYSPYALVSQDKRFSDAELAAEYWSAHAIHERAARGQSCIEYIAKAEAEVWTRFAKLPHFDA